jgi:hypothetical protein
MSALPSKADIVQHDRDVRFVPKADSCTAQIPSPDDLVTLNWDSWPRGSRQKGVQRRHDLRAFADRRGDPLHRLGAHVADRKDSATRRF